MTDEKELDDFIQDGLKKDINQEDKIDESVAQHLGEMGFLWDRVQEKIKNDSICFECKTELVFKDGVRVHIVEANKVEKGVVAFVAICDKCYNKEQEKDTKKLDKKGEKNE